MERKQIVKCVLIALFSALIAAGAFIKIPLVPVPVALSTLFVLLAASCLPPRMALASVVVYLLLGTIGLPIFTSGGGLAALTGPTGGYLFGMIPAVAAGSLVMKVPMRNPMVTSLISAVIATVFIYLVGIPWLSFQMNISLEAALVSGFVPFIVGDALKVAVTAIATPKVRPRVEALLEQR